MIAKDVGIVLRVEPFSNTSAVVTWLMKRQGRRATTIRGAYRPRSLFLGQFDLFYTCEILYYRRLRGVRHTARECCALKTRRGLRDDWRASACASYACDLVNELTPWGAASPEIYELLDAHLDDLSEHGARQELLMCFEMKTLEAYGVAPRLGECVSCGKGLSDRRGRIGFSVSRGGVVCGPCVSGEPGDVRSISRDVVAVLGAWAQAPTVAAARRTRCTAKQLSAARRLLGEFMEYHLERVLQSRGLAFETLLAGERVRRQ
jgi:DNA repair protein RecO (recombination protein O)